MTSALFDKAMTKPFKLLSVVASMNMALIACAPPNPDLGAPPERPMAVEQEAARPQSVNVTPKVDILFVVDNSSSMDAHQENLKANIDRFVAAFETKANVDFHIGVVSVFDSRRFGTVVTDFVPNGQLRPLKDPCRPGVALPGAFITRETGKDAPGPCAQAPKAGPAYSRILGDTIKIGVKPRGTNLNDLGGPEFEEVFSPVLAALEDVKNPGFIRPEAHLAVVMLTDSNDKTPISVRDFYQQVVARKGGDRSLVSFYGILTEGPRRSNVCSENLRDNREAPMRVTNLLANTQGTWFSMCDGRGQLDRAGYGDRLASVGEIIQSRASNTITIRLNTIPSQNDNFKVSCADPNGAVVTVPRDRETGWAYDPDENAIVIGSKVELPCRPNAPLSVVYDAVNPRRMGTKQVRFTVDR